ncbi:hypothetical protein F511_01990 [Dorcoceras hygrometricum]|uniref:Uncharacterized protein n=1 Tax=Dorcoceras hygrometricum TaxID=472368 RepID=A0A2Z7AVV2_9LAMI|nr:hypothetical protein F511_01990 [Dorcoceras hygrometricum]
MPIQANIILNRIFILPSRQLALDGIISTCSMLRNFALHYGHTSFECRGALLLISSFMTFDLAKDKYPSENSKIPFINARKDQTCTKHRFYIVVIGSSSQML